MGLSSIYSSQIYWFKWTQTYMLCDMHRSLTETILVKATMTPSIGFWRTSLKLRCNYGCCHLGSTWLCLTFGWYKMNKELEEGWNWSKPSKINKPTCCWPPYCPLTNAPPPLSVPLLPLRDAYAKCDAQKWEPFIFNFFIRDIFWYFSIRELLSIYNKWMMKMITY